MFLPLRDSTGTIQLVLKGSDQDKTKLRQDLQDLTAESVICAEGRIVARDVGTVNPKMATGEIEVDLTSVTVLNKTHKSLPFLPSNQTVVRGSRSQFTLVTNFLALPMRLTTPSCQLGQRGNTSQVQMSGSATRHSSKKPEKPFISSMGDPRLPHQERYSRTKLL